MSSGAAAPAEGGDADPHTVPDIPVLSEVDDQLAELPFDDDVCTEDLRLLEEATAEEAEASDLSSLLKSGSGRCIQDTIAVSFEAAQKVLLESHRKALSAIARCEEASHEKDKANHELRSKLSLLSNCSTHCTSQSDVADAPGASPWGFQHKLLKESALPPGHVPTSSEESLHEPPPLAPIKAANSGSVGLCMPPNAPLPATPTDAAPSLVPASPVVDAPTDAGESSATSADVCCSPSPEDPPRVPSRAASGTSETSSSRAKIRARRPSIASYVSCASNASMQSCMGNFELLPLWANVQPSRKSKKRSRNLKKLSRSCSFESLSSVESMGTLSDTTSIARMCPILGPNSLARAAWDIMSTLLVVYDLVVIPLELFVMPEQGWVEVMAWITRFFWTVDVCLSFFTGILKPDGSIEMRFTKICRSYLTSWFPVDLFLVLSDWLEVLWSSGSFLGFMRAGKATRTIRIVRLVRLARMRNLSNLFPGRLKSEQVIIVAGIIKVMLVIIGLGHVLACLWYGLADQDRSDTWLRVHGFDDSSLALKYTTSLHWSLLQFAGGTDEIVPQNTGERVYAIGVFLLAFVTAAVFMGRLTSSMTQLHMLSRKDVEKFQMLKRYLVRNEVSGALSVRVMHNAQHALAETQRFMEESSVELLNIISEPLRVELHFELYAPVLAVHPFFKSFVDSCPQVMKKVCHKAMSQLLVSHGDVIFMPGEVPSPPRMFVICSGKLSYTYLTGGLEYLQAGQWISEGTLWTSWTHQGMLKAVSDCRLCILDAQKFHEIAETFDHDFDVRRYARAWVRSMNTGGMHASDLPFNEEDTDDIMEAIASLTQTGESLQSSAAQQMDVENRSGQWSNTSPATSEDLSSPRRSVLMVTPGVGSSDTRGAWW